MPVFCTQGGVLRAIFCKNGGRTVRLKVASVLVLRGCIPISQQIGASPAYLLAGRLYMRLSWHRQSCLGLLCSTLDLSPWTWPGRLSTGTGQAHRCRDPLFLPPQVPIYAHNLAPSFPPLSRGRSGGGWGCIERSRKTVVFPHPHPAPPLEGEGGAIPAIALPTLKRMTNSACAAVRISPSCPCPASSTARDPGQRQRECYRHL